ncbi:hypothetical protein [Parvibaculum sp.]|uniref:hypothetical protein n=1 Tax=Parvibaculum sp. TaxID=2024848 RepID=UPI00262D6F22|nr:hypothetical protein [Parvibaculum sp.]MCW5727262.1 hypothetical protein [Parvibaculum sp.]
MSGWGYAAWQALTETINGVFASLLTAALAGRLAWHTRLVQKGERRFFSKEMGFEAAAVLFLFYVAQATIAGAAFFLNLPEEVAAAVAPGIAALIAYFGPGGIQAAIIALWQKFGGKPS